MRITRPWSHEAKWSGSLRRGSPKGVRSKRVWVLALLVLAACGNKKKAREDAGVRAVDAAVALVRDAGTADAAQKPGRVEHAVWKPVDNRHLAHRNVDTGDLVLDATNASFARYTRFSMPAPRWHLGATV